MLRNGAYPPNVEVGGRAVVKNFQELPKQVSRRVEAFAGNRVEVRTLAKVHPTQLNSYMAFEIVSAKLQVGNVWNVVLPPAVGRTSKKNVEGWEVVRKDLPMYTKTFCHEIPNFGDGSRNGWSVVCQDRRVYHRDFFPPPMLSIQVVVDEALPDGRFGVSFVVLEQFDRSSASFDEDILFAINLLQESLGSFEVVEPAAPKVFFTEVLNWELFPPGSADEVLKSLKVAGRIKKADEEEAAKKRLALFERFEPLGYLRGLGGSDTYIGAKYADDLVVFENVRYGNALYLLYADWEIQSKKPRSELLRMPGDKLDRVVHNEGWTKIFEKLLREQLRKRGMRLRRMRGG